MRTSTALMPITFGLMVSLCLCQTSSPGPIQQAYTYFLQNVVASDRFAPPDPKSASKPPLLQSIGLTDQEMQVVKAQASDFQAKNVRLQRALAPLQQEALFQSLEAGRVSEELVRRISELRNENTKIVSEQIQNLKVALGASRFDVLDEFIRQRF
jgi:hypothetical protein